MLGGVDMAGERMVSQEEKGSFIAYAYNAGIRNLTASQLNRVDECYTFADDVLSYKGISSAPKSLRDELALTYLRLHVQQGQEIDKVGDAAAAAISGGQLDAAMIPEMKPYLISAREYLQKRAGIAPGPSEQEKQTRAAATDLRFGTTKFRTLEGKRIDVYEVDAGARPAEAKLSKGREYPAGEWNAEQGRVAYRQRSSAFHALVDDRRSVLSGMIFVERSEERAGGKEPSLSQKAMGDYNRAGGSVRIQGNLPTPDAWRTSVLINMRDEMGRIWGSESRSLENKLSACEEKYRSYVADIVEFSSPSFQKDVTRWEGVGGIRLDPDGRMADRRVLENRWGVSLDWMLYIGDNYTTTMRTKFDRSLNRIFGMHDEEKQKSESLSGIWKAEFSRLVSYNRQNSEFLMQAREGLEHMARRHKNELDPMHNAIRDAQSEVNAALAPRRFQQPQARA